MSSQVAPEALEQLLTCLRTGTAEERRSAALLLGEAACEEGLIALVSTLSDRDPGVRHEAARALVRFGEPAVAALAARFPEADARHREAIVLALGLLAPGSRAARDFLETLRDDPDLAGVVERACTIQPPPPTDWNRWVDVLGRWFLALALLVGLTDELLMWGGLLSRVQGIALQVAFGWGLIGAFCGAVIGAHCNGAAGARCWAKHLGIAGAIIGALVGQVAAAWMTPLVVALLGQ
jgi:hypothetical protein